MAIIDYCLILIFFLGVIGFVFMLARAPSQPDDVQEATTPAPSAQRKESYAVLAAVFVLLIALAFLSQRGVPGATRT